MYKFSISWSLYIRLDIPLCIYVGSIIIYCVTYPITGNSQGKISGLFHARRLGIKVIFLIQRYTIMQQYLFTSCLALFPSLRQLQCFWVQTSGPAAGAGAERVPFSPTPPTLLYLLNSYLSPRHVQFRHCPSSPSSMVGLCHAFQLLFSWKTALYQDNQWK